MDKDKQTARRIAGWPYCATRSPRMPIYGDSAVKRLRYAVLDAVRRVDPEATTRPAYPRGFGSEDAGLAPRLGGLCRVSLLNAGRRRALRRTGSFERL